MALFFEIPITRILHQYRSKSRRGKKAKQSDKPKGGSSRSIKHERVPQELQRPSRKMDKE